LVDDDSLVLDGLPRFMSKEWGRLFSGSVPGVTARPLPLRYGEGMMRLIFLN